VNIVLQSILGSAAEVTGAAMGWIVVPRDGALEVVAAIGDGDLIGATVGADAGTAAYVLASGQPVAMAARPDDPNASEGVAALLGTRPTAVLCVPCAHDDEILGVLELIDKPGGAAFAFDDVELVTVLANIAGSALRGDSTSGDVRSPEELFADLRQMASADPTAYIAVATVLEALLARG
jgi:phosphoserine phosphatase RsbU/P